MSFPITHTRHRLEVDWETLPLPRRVLRRDVFTGGASRRKERRGSGNRSGGASREKRRPPDLLHSRRKRYTEAEFRHEGQNRDRFHFSADLLAGDDQPDRPGRHRHQRAQRQAGWRRDLLAAQPHQQDRGEAEQPGAEQDEGQLERAEPGADARRAAWDRRRPSPRGRAAADRPRRSGTGRPSRARRRAAARAAAGRTPPRRRPGRAGPAAGSAGRAAIDARRRARRRAAATGRAAG